MSERGESGINAPTSFSRRVISGDYPTVKMSTETEGIVLSVGNGLSALHIGDRVRLVRCVDRGVWSFQVTEKADDEHRFQQFDPDGPIFGCAYKE